MVHDKEFKITEQLKLRIAFDAEFWVIPAAIAVGKLHQYTWCRCVGIAVQFGPFFVEVFIQG